MLKNLHIIPKNTYLYLLTINSPQFEIIFKKSDGTIQSFRFRDNEFISNKGGVSGGPFLNVYRAPTGNDNRSLGTAWQITGLDKSTPTLVSFRWEKVNDSKVFVSVQINHKMNYLVAFCQEILLFVPYGAY